MVKIQRRDLMKGIMATVAAMALPGTIWANPITEERMVEVFNQVSQQTSDPQFVGAFPDFCIPPLKKGLVSTIVGTVSIKVGFAELRDHVPLTDLGKNLSVTDWAGIMRATHDYATRQGFLTGFPTFNFPKVGGKFPKNKVGPDIYTPVVLIKSQLSTPGNLAQIILTNVSLAELGNVDLNDSLGRFRATTKYARKHGFVGGFPNMYHTNLAGPANHLQTVCGTLLVRSGAATTGSAFITSWPLPFNNCE
ncbi:MAG TPA: hypothetical protein VGK21_05105 [Candidatus Angelobacter sp.]|jgi:hypothetical protein